MTATSSRKERVFGDEGTRTAGSTSVLSAVAFNCVAEDCPCRAHLLIDGNASRGLCVYHATADSNLWPRITEILTSPKGCQMRWALHHLRKNLEDKPQIVLRAMAQVQRAALAFGFPREEVARVTMGGWVDRRWEQFPEEPRAFEYRISQKFIVAVIELADHKVHAAERANSMRRAEEALAILAGRGKRLMDGPVDLLEEDLPF